MTFPFDPSLVERLAVGEGTERIAPTPMKTPVKILDALENHPGISLKEVARTIGKSLRAVERAVAKLQQEGKLKRVGPDRFGRWEVTIPKEKPLPS